jgi:hypothetical protein
MLARYAALTVETLNLAVEAVGRTDRAGGFVS